jgi:hypothetical protein
MAPKKGTKRVVKQRPPLNFDNINFVKVQPGMEMRTRRPTRGEREPEQVLVDNIVKEAYDNWTKQGRPTEWDEIEGTEATVPTVALETLQWRLRRAGGHFGMKIRFGDITSADGFSQVVFTATDKPERDDATDDEREAEDEAAEDEAEYQDDGDEDGQTNSDEYADVPDLAPEGAFN